MSKLYKLATIFVLLIINLLIVPSTFAATVATSGSLGSGPTFNRPFTCGGLSGIGTNVFYDTIPFEVDVSGSYTMTVTGFSGADTVLILYSPSFSAGSQLTNCINYNDDFNFPISFLSEMSASLVAGTSYVLVLTTFSNGDTGTYSIDFTGPGTAYFPTSGTSPVGGVPLPAFFDDRINNYDTAAPVIVYPHYVNSETGLIIYDVEGVEILVVSPQQIADAPDNPDSPILIAQVNGVSLYRIPADGRGLWQINAPQYNGKTYVMIFPELFHSGGYESFELDG